MKYGAFDTLARGLAVLAILGFSLHTAYLFTHGPQVTPDGQPLIEQDLAALCRIDTEEGPHSWNRIIVHHSGVAGMTFNDIKMFYLKQGYKRIPYHFLIRPDGYVICTENWIQQDWAPQTDDEDTNLHGIGVCVIGNFSLPETVPGEVQFATLEELMRSLMKEYKIKKVYIWRASDLTKTESPGINFPWNRLLRRLD